MKKQLISYLLAMIVSITINGQTTNKECDPVDLAEIPGTWIIGLKGSTAGVSATDLQIEKTILSNIHKMIAASYQPIGCESLYGNSFEGSNLPNNKTWLADHFSYNLYISRYLCDMNSPDKSKYYIDISTPTSVNITANFITDINMYTGPLKDDHFRGYLKLTQMPEIQDGYYFLGKEDLNPLSDDKIIQYTWLITYNDTLPFTFISRKEYLLITKKRLEHTIQENGNTSGYYTQYMDNIDKELKESADYLSKQAICMWNDEENFKGFVEENTKGSFIAIKPNMAYYHKGLKKSVPQFFIFTYKLDPKDPVFKENIERIKKAVDFEKLRAMLGK